MSSAVPAWSRVKMLWTKARSIGRRSCLRGIRAASCAARPGSGCLRRSTPWRRARAAQRARDGARRKAPRATRPMRCRRPATARIPGLDDVIAGCFQIVGAVGDVAIDRARLVGAAIALHVDAPAIESEPGEIIHHRGMGPARNLEIECRLRGHRRAVHEQDGGLAVGRSGAFLPQEEFHISLARPMLPARNLGAALPFHRAHTPTLFICGSG